MKKNGEQKCSLTYFDFISSGKTQDYHFVKGSFNYLKKKGYFKGLKKIIFWSDNGSHFKNHKTIAFFSELSAEVGVQINQHFFMASHAANECDGHFGVLKRREKNEKRAKRPIFAVEEYCKFAEQSSKNTFAYDLDALGTYQPEQINVTGIEGLRGLHEFIYIKKHQLKAREWTGEGEWQIFNLSVMLESEKSHKKKSKKAKKKKPIKGNKRKRKKHHKKTSPRKTRKKRIDFEQYFNIGKLLEDLDNSDSD